MGKRPQQVSDMTAAENVEAARDESEEEAERETVPSRGSRKHTRIQHLANVHTPRATTSLHAFEGSSSNSRLPLAQEGS